MRDLQAMDLTPKRRTSTKPLADVGGGGQARVVRLAVRLLKGKPLSRAVIQAQSGVSRATAQRDLRVTVDAVRQCGVRVRRADGGVYSVSDGAAR